MNDNCLVVNCKPQKGIAHMFITFRNELKIIFDSPEYAKTYSEELKENDTKFALEDDQTIVLTLKQCTTPEHCV